MSYTTEITTIIQKAQNTHLWDFVKFVKKHSDVDIQKYYDDFTNTKKEAVCLYLYKKGKLKQSRCGATAITGSSFCSKHKKSTVNVQLELDDLTDESADGDSSGDEWDFI